jgi:hypothetical protein
MVMMRTAIGVTRNVVGTGVMWQIYGMGGELLAEYAAYRRSRTRSH